MFGVTRAPDERHPQFATSERVEAEITIRFNIRPAGWIGNDGWSAETPLLLIRLIREAAKLIGYADEGISRITWRWRRDDEAWRDEQEVREPL